MPGPDSVGGSRFSSEAALSDAVKEVVSKPFDYRGEHAKEVPGKEGFKTDSGKDRWDLLPFRALKEVAKVMTSGLKKYPEWNWINVPKKKNRYFAATMRHLVSWRTGETLDPETGLHHLAHAACCVLFLLHSDLGGGSENSDQ